MNHQVIQSLYSYNCWANRRIRESCAKVSIEQFTAPTSFSWGSLRGTLVHVLDSERAFRALCQQVSVGDDLTEANLATFAALEQYWQEEEQAMLSYLSGLSDEDASSVIRYRSSNGKLRERFVWQILFHLVNHGMQHRSEAAAMLTDYGHSPDDIDYSLFLVEQEDNSAP